MTISTCTHPGDGPRDAVLRTIEALALAMRTDYAQAFLAAYPSTEAVRDLKNRLWTRLKAYPPAAIVDGFDTACRTANGFLPNIQQITDGVAQVAAEMRREAREEAQAEHVRQLPPPAPPAADAASRFTAWMAEARAAQQRPLCIRDPAAYDAQRAAHDRLIQRDIARGRIRTPAVATVTCAAGCGQPAALTTSTNGSAHWYCRNHAQR